MIFRLKHLNTKLKDITKYDGYSNLYELTIHRRKRKYGYPENKQKNHRFRGMYADSPIPTGLFERRVDLLRI